MLTALIKIDTQMPESSTTGTLTRGYGQTHTCWEKPATEIITKYLFICLTFTRLLFAFGFSFYFSSFCFIKCLSRHKTNQTCQGRRRGVYVVTRLLNVCVQEAALGHPCPPTGPLPRDYLSGSCISGAQGRECLSAEGQRTSDPERVRTGN